MISRGGKPSTNLKPRFCNNTLLIEHKEWPHQEEINPGNIDDGSSGSNDQGILNLEQVSTTSSPDDMFYPGQSYPEYLLSYQTLCQNSESEVNACQTLQQQYQAYTNPVYETDYSYMHSGESDKVEPPGMNVYAGDGTPVWPQSCIAPFDPPPIWSWTAQGDSLLATLPMPPVAEVQPGMVPCQQPMQSHMVYPQQGQGPYYQFSTF